jgi:hypothetical protein
VYVKKAEIGEINGWNPQRDEWMFKYTLDFVSTGLDEYGGDGSNDVISSMLLETMEIEPSWKNTLSDGIDDGL